MAASRQIALPRTASVALSRWIERGMEGLWLLTVALVPLAFLGREFGEWSSVIGSFELPKIALLRTLVALMVVLWLVEWALKGGLYPAITLDGYGTFAYVKSRPAALAAWLRGQPVRWLFLAVIFFLINVVLSTALSVSLDVSLWGDVPGQDSYSFYTISTYVVLFGVIATHLRTEAQLRRLLSSVILMGVLIGGYAIFQHYGRDFLDLLEPPTAKRVTSTTGGAVFAASVMLMTIGVTLASATASLKEDIRSVGFSWKLALWSLALAVQSLGIIFTFSRGPWAGTIVVLALFFGLTIWAVGRQAFARAALVFALAATVTLIVLVLPIREGTGESGAPASSTIAEIPQRFTVAAAAEGGISGRLDIWGNSWDLMVHRPWFGFEGLGISFLRPVIGYGPDLFRASYLLETPARPLDEFVMEPAHAHNYFVHHGVELGFLGILTSIGLYAAVLLAGVALLLKARRQASPIFYSIGLVGILAVTGGRLLEQFFGVARVSDLTLFWALLAVFAVLPALRSSPIENTGTSSTVSRSRRPDRRVSRTPTSHRSHGLPPILLLILIVGLIGGIGILTWTRTIDSQRAAYLADKAASQFRGGDLQGSLGSLDKAVRLAPDISEYRARRAFVLSDLPKNGDPLPRRECTNTGDQAAFRLCLAQQVHRENLDWVATRPFDYRSRIAAAGSAVELWQLTGDPVYAQESIGLYEDTADMVPNSWTILNRVAQIYIGTGQYEQALQRLRESLAITSGHPNAARTLLLRSQARRDQGQMQLAIEDLNQAILAAPRSGKVYFARAEVLHEVGRYRDAVEDFDETIRLERNNILAFFGRGTSYLALSDFIKAIDDFDQAILRDPDLALAYNNRGLARASLGQWEKALPDFDEAIRIDEKIAPAFNNRGLVLRELGLVDRAIEDLDNAIDLDPQLGMAYFNRALAYTIAGQDLAASLDVESAVALGIDRGLLEEAFQKIKSSP